MPRVIQIPATSIMVYTPRELREKSPAAYKVALARWQKKQQNDPDDYYNREIVKSLKALISAAGLEMKDWSLGAYNQNNFLKVAGFQENSEDDSKSAENFTGRRAMAWMENNLYRKLRVPFAPPAVRYGHLPPHRPLHTPSTAPGAMRDCPLTGCCYDRDFLEGLEQDIGAGIRVGRAFENLAGKCAFLMEQESDYRQSEDYFLESGEDEYTEDGTIFRAPAWLEETA